MCELPAKKYYQYYFYYQYYSIISISILSGFLSPIQFHDAVICGVHVFKLYKPSLLKEPL